MIASSGTKEVAFLEILNDHFLTQFNFIPTRRDRVLLRMCRTVFACERCSVQKNRMCSRTMARCLLSFTPLQKLLTKWKEWCTIIVMETLTVFRELLKPWIYAILFKTATTSAWTGLTGGTHLGAQKYQRKKTPHLGSQVESSTLAQSWRNLLLTINNRSIANSVEKAKTLTRQSREIYFSSLDSEFARQPKRFWSFFKLKNKTWWAGDSCENGFDISQTARYKQSNWIRWNFSAPAGGNRWPDRTVPDHLIQQILAARHFSGRLETGENYLPFINYHFFIALFPFSLSSPNGSLALRSGGSTGSYIPPHQSRTAWLFSR